MKVFFTARLCRGGHANDLLCGFHCTFVNPILFSFWRCFLFGGNFVLQMCLPKTLVFSSPQSSHQIHGRTLWWTPIFEQFTYGIVSEGVLAEILQKIRGSLQRIRRERVQKFFWGRFAEVCGFFCSDDPLPNDPISELLNLQQKNSKNSSCNLGFPSISKVAPRIAPRIGVLRMA